MPFRISQSTRKVHHPSSMYTKVKDSLGEHYSPETLFTDSKAVLTAIRSYGFHQEDPFAGPYGKPVPLSPEVCMETHRYELRHVYYSGESSRQRELRLRCEEYRLKNNKRSSMKLIQRYSLLPHPGMYVAICLVQVRPC